MVFDTGRVYIKPILQNALEVDLHFKKTTERDSFRHFTIHIKITAFKNWEKRTLTTILIKQG